MTDRKALIWYSQVWCGQKIKPDVLKKFIRQHQNEIKDKGYLVVQTKTQYVYDPLRESYYYIYSETFFVGKRRARNNKLIGLVRKGNDIFMDKLKNEGVLLLGDEGNE